MSHIGFWRTHWGDLRGWNLRFKLGGRYVTCLAHTRPVEARVMWDGDPKP